MGVMYLAADYVHLRDLMRSLVRRSTDGQAVSRCPSSTGPSNEAMRLPKIDVGFQKIAAKQLRRLILVDEPKGWGLLPNTL